jgi:hypothetical protein
VSTVNDQKWKSRVEGEIQVTYSRGRAGECSSTEELVKSTVLAPQPSREGSRRETRTTAPVSANAVSPDALTFVAITPCRLVDTRGAGGGFNGIEPFAGPSIAGAGMVYNSGPATIDVIIDMNGYFTAPTDLNDNTAIGTGPLANNTTGNDNTASSGLLRLCPVTFGYKRAYEDGSKPIDYGLIAEEVANVYPGLVVTGKDGQIQTVQFQKLTPMLLNELQKQHAEVQELNPKLDQQHLEAEKQNQRARQQDETIRQLQARLAALEALLGKVTTASTPRQ